MFDFTMSSLKVLFILVFNLNILLIITDEDPDLKLCEDLTIDAAVSADDGNDYIFKGDYFWQLNTFTGIVDTFAQVVYERWPHLPTPIDTGFLLDEGSEKGKSTIFIKGQEWYKYKSDSRLDSGSTADWPHFPIERIQAAFNLINVTSVSTPIFFIYKDDDYSKYIITDIKNPKMQQIGKTWRMGRFLYFLEGSDAGTDSFQLLKDIIKVRGVLANKHHLVFFGQQNYCIANITIVSPSCEKYSPSVLFKCPRKPYPGRRKTPEPTTVTVTTLMDNLPMDQNSTKQNQSLTPEESNVLSFAIRIKSYYSLYIYFCLSALFSIRSMNRNLFNFVLFVF